jgi:hypothetical protein
MPWPGFYHLGKNPPSTHWIGDWVGRRAGLDTGARRKILCLCLGSNHGHLVIQSLRELLVNKVFAEETSNLAGQWCYGIDKTNIRRKKE